MLRTIGMAFGHSVVTLDRVLESLHGSLRFTIGRAGQ